MAGLNEIEEKYWIKLDKLHSLGVEKDLLTPVSFAREILSGPYVDFEDGVYIIKSYGGNRPEIKLKTKSLDRALFSIFVSLTHNLAFKYELHHRVENQDFRIIAFQKQIDILEKLEFDPELLNELKIKRNEALGWKLFETLND